MSKNLPNDQLILLAIKALDKLLLKDLTNNQIREEIKEIRDNIIIKENWDNISNDYEACDYILYALELYKLDYQEEINNNIWGTINSMITDLKVWLTI